MLKSDTAVRTNTWTDRREGGNSGLDNQYSAAIKSSKNSQQVSVVLNSECSAALKMIKKSQKHVAGLSYAQQCSAELSSAVLRSDQ